MSYKIQEWQRNHAEMIIDYIREQKNQEKLWNLLSRFEVFQFLSLEQDTSINTKYRNEVIFKAIKEEFEQKILIPAKERFETIRQKEHERKKLRDAKMEELAAEITSMETEFMSVHNKQQSELEAALKKKQEEWKRLERERQEEIKQEVDAKIPL